MKPDDLRNIEAIAKMDQAATALGNVAVLLGSFYQQLIASGIPSDLAADMVRDYFEQLREGMR